MKQSANRVILGLDPGTQATGYGVVAYGHPHKMLTCGAVRTKPADPLPMRLHKIYIGIQQIIDEFKPDVIVIEDPFLGKNVSSALALGRVGGVLMLLAEINSIPIETYAPRTIKASVVGRGSASKDQVQFMVQRLLALKSPPKPQDASDALAAALCFLNRQGFTANLERKHDR